MTNILLSSMIGLSFNILIEIVANFLNLNKLIKHSKTGQILFKREDLLNRI